MLTDMLSRTAPGAIMRGAQWWVIAVVLQNLLLGVSCGHHRRSMASPSTLPLSKGGWRPVINSGLPGYGAFVAAPLHASSYKYPVPVMDSYPSSSRPVATRESPHPPSSPQPSPPRPTSPQPAPPRPATHRSLPSPASPPPNQPIHTYYNPFAVPNSLTHYNFVQSYPVEKIIIRNPHNPYAARPVFTKHQNKFKQNYHNQMIQQLNNVQPIQFGAPIYPTLKPHDVFGKPVEGYARPGDFQKKPQPTSGTEIYKQELYKLPDSDPAPQSHNQQVKTAQQQSNVAKQQTDNQYQTNQYQQYQQYQFKDEKFAPIPSSVLGPFNNFGMQAVKGRDPFYQSTKSTYIPTLPPKHTLFNSYSYSPHFKSTLSVSQFPSTTPKLQSTLNHIQFGSTSDYRPTSDQPAKIPNNVKTEPNTGKVSFKPSPQDPFIKYQVSTYNPNAQTSTVSSFFNNYQTQSPQNTYYNVPTFSFENKKHKIHDSLGSSVNQQQSSVIPHKKPEPETVPHRPTYEVTEVYEQDDIHTQASPNPWVTPETFDFLSNQQKPGTEDSVTSPDYTNDDAYRKQTLPPNDLSEEYAIVTESEKDYENSLHYDSLNTQNIKPVKEEPEPIGKHKLKEYYYKVTTPSYDETTHQKRYKNRPTESPEQEQDLTTVYNSIKSETPPDALPTLPPNKHFKRPSSPDSTEKDKLKKRLKTRRRRPPGTNSNNNQEQKPSTESNEGQTKRPRVRIPKPKPHDSFTTPTLSNDVASSAVPTITPTTPTTPKKKLHRHRPHLNTHEKLETSSRSTTTESGDDKESPIMKIAIRPHHLRSTTASYDSSSSEAPDYSHKQDEKDTPTSDIAVNLSDNQRNKQEPGKQFSFHRDVKPIEASVEPIRYPKETTTSETSVLPLETTTSSSEEDITTTTSKILKPRLKTKYDRPKFSVKDYRSRLSSTTTSTTERSSESHAPKLRFPQRRPFENKNKNENETAERKKFIPKDPRHKSETSSTASDQTEEPHPTRHPYKPRQTTADTTETTGTTQKISSRIRSGVRRRPTEETTESANPTTVHLKRPIRKKVKDSEIGESVQDVAVTETTPYEKDDATSERTRSESAIMKIAKDDKKNHVNEALDRIFEHSKRVSDLTLAASKDYNTPGKFKTVSPNSRRIPNYFTIATDDPILPIEAFFPQLNQKKES